MKGEGKKRGKIAIESWDLEEKEEEEGEGDEVDL